MNLFFRSCGIVLLLTSGTKLMSLIGGPRVLDTIDPILSISFRHVFVVAALIEFAIGCACLFMKNQHLKAGLVALLSSNFALYRFGLFWVGYGPSCLCLGNFTDALHIPPQTADTVMKIILAYLLIGSYGILFWLWRQRKKSAPATV